MNDGQGAGIVRLLAVLLLFAVLLSGCVVQIQGDDDTDRRHTTQQRQQALCTRDGEPCDARTDPTGPNMTFDVHETHAATEGIDKTYVWSVHPGAEIAHLRLRITGPNSTAYAAADHGYELLGPGVRASRACPTVSTSIGPPGTTARDLIDRDLEVGDWRLRVCSDRGVAEMQVHLDVDYPA